MFAYNYLKNRHFSGYGMNKSFSKTVVAQVPYM